jgi:hypothetical protein
VTWQFGGRGRHRKRERESGRETGRGCSWASWLESGERWREPRDREREGAAERVERQGEAGEWRALERPRQRERKRDGERLESGERWQSGQSALRWSALEWVKASSGLDSSRLQRELQDCGRKKNGRRSAAAKRGAEDEEKGGRRQPKEKGNLWEKKKARFSLFRFSFDF